MRSYLVQIAKTQQRTLQSFKRVESLADWFIFDFHTIYGMDGWCKTYVFNTSVNFANSIQSIRYSD